MLGMLAGVFCGASSKIKRAISGFLNPFWNVLGQIKSQRPASYFKGQLLHLNFCLSFSAGGNYSRDSDYMGGTPKEIRSEQGEAVRFLLLTYIYWYHSLASHCLRLLCVNLMGAPDWFSLFSMSYLHEIHQLKRHKVRVWNG